MSVPDQSSVKQLFACLRSHLQQMQAPLASRWQMLAPWQQNAGWLGSAILAIALIWFGLWQPLQQAHLRADQTLQQAQKKLSRMQSQAALLGNWRGNVSGNDIADAEQNPIRDIAHIALQSAGLYGVQVSLSNSTMAESESRLQANRLVLHVKNTPWSACLEWIAALHRQQISLVSLSLQSSAHGLELEAVLTDRMITAK